MVVLLRECGTPLQLFWAVQCSTDHVWHGGPFNRWPASMRHPSRHSNSPPSPPPPSPLSSLTYPPSPPILPHLLSSLTPSPLSYCAPPLSFLRCATLPSALWGGCLACTPPARCCSSSDSPPSQTSPGREQLSFLYTHDNHPISPPSLSLSLSLPPSLPLLPPSLPLLPPSPSPSLSSLPLPPSPSIPPSLTRYTIDHASDFPPLTMEPRFYLISGVVCSMSITEKYT